MIAFLYQLKVVVNPLTRFYTSLLGKPPRDMIWDLSTTSLRVELHKRRLAAKLRAISEARPLLCLPGIWVRSGVINYGNLTILKLIRVGETCRC